MIVFSNTITPRLQYILDFIGKEIIREPLLITTNTENFRQYNGPRINYSKKRITDEEFQIQNSELLFEDGIRMQTIECFETNDYKAFYKTEGDFPFDIFAASFYLLSRYEEYLPHKKDNYGRYAHENSLAFKESFLHLPLISIWIEYLKKALTVKFPQFQTTTGSQFRFIPTYDIDEAYSYKYKQWWRTIGAIAGSAINGHWSKIGERVSVLRGKKRDPFDSFEWMHRLNRQYDLRPYYFFLVANKTGMFDKNILPAKKVMQELIQDHGSRYSIGIHPSWQSGDDPNKLKFEILTLGHISGQQILSSRQHFIRFTLPDTYRLLINSGIESDFSMGYGSINGFRASVTTPFFWYDLEQEKKTQLLVYPFCFMEANSFFEQKLTPPQALEELNHYYNVVKSVNGSLITIWHNTFFGTDKLFTGWKEIYEQFVKLASG